jgi:gamma-glutamyltranspeptidase
MHDVMLDILSTPSALEGMRQWPSTRSVFLPDGHPIPLGARVVQTSPTLRLLVEAEGRATTREAGIRAARDRFYTGDIAERMVRLRASKAAG